MTSAIVLKLIATYKDQIFAGLINVKDEVINAFDKGITDYVDNFQDKFSKTKTFIYRDERVNFYDVFYPVAIKNIDVGVSDADIFFELFDKKRYIAIIGNAGSGKSMLMKHIFLKTVEKLYCIPLIIELRNLNEFNGSITEYIYKTVLKNKILPSEKILERVLGEGNFLFLFDGYDEIYSDNKNKITTDLEEFVDTYSKNIFVLTSRPGANAESLQRFDNFYVEPLNSKQVNEFIALQFKNHENKDSIGKIVSVIQKPENRDYTNYLANPLLLSMFIFTFNSYPELPRSKHRFYWNVFDTLCTKHDAFTKKGFWIHERKSKLLNEDFESILKWFSYISIFKGRYNFDIIFLKETLNEIKAKLNINCDVDGLIYDLTVSISIIMLDGIEYTFPHKSLQEYFTALLIKDLTESQKQKIYTQRFYVLSRKATGGNLNLFKLCYELDKHHFSKFYLLKNAKEFISVIDNEDEQVMLKSFFKYFSLKIEFSRRNNKYVRRSYSHMTFAFDSFLSFFDIHSLNFPSDSDAVDANFYLIKETLRPRENMGIKMKDDISYGMIDFLSNWNDKNYKFLIEIGIAKSAIELIEKVKENIEKIEAELKSETENTKTLLEI